ncbi:MAG: asparagine synthase C-terminal domain-containing protein [Bacteroidales bacterium]|jgi:asparagine synthase (glutamine-hydrolysing)|nr:asparagine synthase C-terminal domain-containing protein [Bacteroidales bacterium]
MITLKLTGTKAFNWFEENEVYAKGYCFATDGNFYRDSDLCSYFNVNSEEELKKKLLEANGRFSVIVKRDNILWAAVDRFRYFPLFYKQISDVLLISDDINTMFADGEKKVVESESSSVFMALSFVLGKKTLLKGIFQIQAGELLTYKKQTITFCFYHKMFSQINNISYSDAKKQLREILEHAGKRMAVLIGKRKVFLSLSGGLDSRLVAVLLKENKIDNVECFTYGVKTANPEWKISKEVAENLHFKWQFIDYSQIDPDNLYHTNNFTDFYQSVSLYVSKFAFSPYFAAKILSENNIRKLLNNPADMVLITGDGGDFFAGSQFRPYMKNYYSVKTIANDLQYRHCDLIKLNYKEIKLVKRIIKQELLCDEPLFANIDNWVLKERYAKYIINNGKLWDYFNFEYQNPLCDTELMDFFSNLPFDYRLNKKLYIDVISDMFDKYDISFTKDKKIEQQKPFIQKIKILIKRCLPFVRRNQNVFLTDYFDLKRFYKPILKELETAGCNRKLLSQNGILTLWYLMKVKH